MTCLESYESRNGASVYFFEPIQLAAFFVASRRLGCLSFTLRKYRYRCLLHGSVIPTFIDYTVRDMVCYLEFAVDVDAAVG